MVVSDAKHLPVCMFGTICKLQKWCLCADDLFLIGFARRGRTFQPASIFPFNVAPNMTRQLCGSMVWLPNQPVWPARSSNYEKRGGSVSQCAKVRVATLSSLTFYMWICSSFFLAFLVTVPIAGVINLTLVSTWLTGDMQQNDVGQTQSLCWYARIPWLRMLRRPRQMDPCRHWCRFLYLDLMSFLKIESMNQCKLSFTNFSFLCKLIVMTKDGVPPTRPQRLAPRFGPGGRD